MRTDADTLGQLLDARTKHRDLVALGEELGKLFTDHGFPLDMSLAELRKRKDFDAEQQLAVIAGACDWLIEHKRLSGAPEKAIERQRKSNRAMVNSFLKMGEVGVY